MLATGIVCLVLGWIIANLYGGSNPFVTTKGEWIAGSFLIVGIMLSLAGAATWLWQNMP